MPNTGWVLPKRRTLIRFDQVSYYLSKGDYRKAEELIKEALRNDPENAMLHGYLALVYIHTKQAKPAKRELEIALTAEPEVAWFHYLLYRYFLLIGNTLKARNAIRNALALDPEDADYYAALAALDLDLHFYDTALQYAEKGLSIDPNHVHCLNIRTDALKKLGRKKQAAQNLQQTLQEHPEHAYTHESAGWMYLREGLYAKAEEHFRYSLSKDPNDTSARQGYLETLRARYAIYRILSSFSAGFSRVYSEYYYVLLIVLLMTIKVTEASVEDPDLQQFYPVNVAFIVLFVVSMPVWIYPLLNYFNLRRGIGALVYEPHEKAQARFAAIVVPLSLVVILVSLFMPVLHTAIGFTLLSTMYLSYGLFCSPSARFAFIPRVLAGAIFLFGCFCVAYTYTGKPFINGYVVYLGWLSCLPAVVNRFDNRMLPG